MKLRVFSVVVAAALLVGVALAAAASVGKPVPGGLYTVFRGGGTGVGVKVGPKGTAVNVTWRISAGGCTYKIGRTAIGSELNDAAAPGGVNAKVTSTGAFSGRRTTPPSWDSTKYKTFLLEAKGQFSDDGKAVTVKVRRKSYSAKAMAGGGIWWTKCDGRWLSYRLTLAE